MIAGILRIAPERQLVVVQTRNDAGRGYQDYLQKFMDAIAAAMMDSAPGKQE